MQSTNIPTRYQKVWGVNAAGAYIRTVPVASQIGIQDGAASFDTGFVPDNFTPVAAGGVPPFGQDFNGILNVDTAWMQWMQAGGPIPYDSTFASAIGGYPKGAVLSSAVVLGAQWYSTVENNTTNPDDPLTSSGWARVGVPAGAIASFPGSVPTGYVSLNGSGSGASFTIGSASSGASYAAADALFLYAYNWSNSQLAIYTSAGAVTSRGANAIADFNANKRLALPDGRGAGLIGVDNGTTNLTGVPVVAGNTTTPGSTFGENLHSLSAAENGTHDHNVYLKDNTHFHSQMIPGGPQSLQGGGTFPTGNIGAAGANTGSASANITIGSVNGVANDNKTATSGSGTAHNTVQRSLGVNWGQKL